MREHGVHRTRKIAAVPDLAVRGVIRHLGRRHEVALAQRHRIDAGGARSRLDQALHQVHPFGLAGTAKGIGRHGVRVRGAGRERQQRDAVDVRQRARKADHRRGGRERRGVCAHVAVRLAAQREHAPFGVEREFGHARMVARLGVAHQRLAARGHPAHRLACQPRGEKHRTLLRVVHKLHTEAAADLGGHDPQPRLLDAEARRDQRTHQVHALGLGVEAVGAAHRIVAANGGTGLERQRADPVVQPSHLHHVRRIGEGEGDRIRIAERAHHRDLLARLRVEHRRKRRVLNRDALRAIERHGHGLGDHHRHRITDEAHRGLGKHLAQRRVERGAVGARERARALERTYPGGGEVGRGEHSAHPVECARLRDVDPEQPGMRMRRAHEHGVQAIRVVQILDEAARAAQQALVLETMHHAPMLLLLMAPAMMPEPRAQRIPAAHRALPGDCAARSPRLAATIGTI